MNAERRDPVAPPGRESWWRRLGRRLLLERTSPANLAAAVFVGVLVGVSPFYGLQMVLVILLATTLRLNRLAALSAVQISVPPLYPFLVLASLETGSLVLRGKWLGLRSEEVPRDFLGAWTLLQELAGVWLVGSLVVGTVLGALVAGLVLLLAALVSTPEELSEDGLGEDESGDEVEPRDAQSSEAQGRA